MWVHFIAVLSLGALCGVWVLVQCLVDRHTPGRGRPAGGCGGCGHDCASTDESAHSR